MLLLLLLLLLRFISIFHISIKASKALATFLFVLHEVSLNLYLSETANSIPSSCCTSLSPSLSALFPNNITGMSFLQSSFILSQ